MDKASVSSTFGTPLVRGSAMFFLLLVALWAVAWRVQQPAAPVGDDAPALQFSESRAMRVVRKLADEIGTHPVGSAQAAVAADYLAAELRKLPRVEVELHDVEGDTRLNVWSEVAFHYRVRNVVARLPGKRTDALLINAHYDSPVEAHGGADNGIGTAAALETMRALAAAPQLEWTVILNLNGGEEAGSGGAAGFLQHRFAKDVRAFIDTDGSARGRANLMQASADYPALLRAYAGSVRSPLATVFGNDFVQSGLSQASGDFEPLTRAGLPGLDLAAVGDTWGVHTHLDRSTRLQPGTLQDLGNTMLALALRLASDAPQLSRSSERTVYYDVLGLTTLVYSQGTARLLTLLSLLLLLGSIVQIVRKGHMTTRDLLSGLGVTVTALFAGLLAALLAAGVVSVGLGRAHGFYATPWLIVPAYVGAGLCGILAVHALWRRRQERSGEPDRDRVLLVTWAAGLVLWAVVLSLCTLGSLGLGYLPLWWVLPGAPLLALAGGRPRARLPLWLLAVAIGMTQLIHLAMGLFPAMIGLLIGMSPTPAPGDVMMVVLLWLLILAPLALSGMAFVHRAGSLRPLFVGCLGIALIGLLTMALRMPYSPDRPKRLLAVHAMQNGQSAVLLSSQDYLPVDSLAATLQGVEAVPSSESWEHFMPPGWLPPFRHKLKAAPLSLPPPRLEVIERRDDGAQGTRTLRLRLFAQGWVTFVHIPREPLAGWSLGDPLPQPIAGQRTVTALFVAPNANGQDFTLQLRGSAPVEVTIVEAQTPDRSPELSALPQRLPAWTTLNARTLQVLKISL